MSLFCSNSITWPLPLGSPGISPKLKTDFSLFLSLSDKPPHFTPAQPPDGKSSVFPLRLPALTSEVLRGVPANNDLAQQIPASEMSCCLHIVPELAAYLFVSMLLVWQTRGQVGFDVRGIF